MTGFYGLPPITLEKFITRENKKFSNVSLKLSRLLSDIGFASKIISKEIRSGGDLNNFVGKNIRKNVHGESVKKIDLFANEHLISALSRSYMTSVVISEENQEVISVSPESGKYIVYIDPIDGSSNTDVCVSLGSIFSIYEKPLNRNTTNDEYDVLQKGRNQVAAGYTLYGSSTIFVYTSGHGVNLFKLDPSTDEFIFSKGDINLPKSGSYYSVNEGNYNSCETGIKQYIKYCQEEDFSTKRPYKYRYVGSMVADIHRTMLFGGIFFYPCSKKYPEEKLRLMYECNPLGFIIEQAGGLAMNGEMNILDIKPESIHQSVPLYVGSRRNVEKLKQFIDEQ